MRLLLLPVDTKHQIGGLRTRCSCTHLQRYEFDAFVLTHNFVLDKRDQIILEYFLLLVGEIFEPCKSFLQSVIAQLKPQLGQLGFKRMSARMLAQHQFAFGQAHGFRRHDFIGVGVLEHTILMDSAFMREGVRADNGFIRLHVKTCNRRKRARNFCDFCRLDSCRIRHEIMPRAQRHDDFLKRRIARTLADAVDRAFDLARPRLDARQRIRHRQTQIVVAMRGYNRLVDIGNAFKQHGDFRAVFFRHAVAHGIRDVHRRRAGFDGDLDGAAQEIVFGTRSILCAPFHIVGESPRKSNTFSHGVQNLFRRHLQFMFHMQRRG